MKVIVNCLKCSSSLSSYIFLVQFCINEEYKEKYDNVAIVAKFREYIKAIQNVPPATHCI